MDVHCKDILKGCIYQRFPDVVDFNFDLVKVHWSISAIEPVVNHARYHYVLAVFEEELKESIAVLKLDLPPYVEIGAIFVPLALTKRRLIAQTGIDMVCGPEGELCVCYHNGHELLNGDETFTYDGDFLRYFRCNCVPSWSTNDEPCEGRGLSAPSALSEWWTVQLETKSGATGEFGSDEMLYQLHLHHERECFL